jgi:hypothetical protein
MGASRSILECAEVVGDSIVQCIPPCPASIHLRCYNSCSRLALEQLRLGGGLLGGLERGSRQGLAQ